MVTFTIRENVGYILIWQTDLSFCERQKTISEKNKHVILTLEIVPGGESTMQCAKFKKKKELNSLS